MAKSYNKDTLSWLNTTFLIVTPILFIASTALWLSVDGFDINQLWLGVVFYCLTGLSITAGYHRLFAHRSYKANSLVKLFFLTFGAAAFQNSILKWGSDHRLHHNKVDTEADPYNINEGFFYAHMGWILLKDNDTVKEKYAKDFYRDPLVLWQHKYYLIISAVFGIIMPTVLGGVLFGSYLGGFALGAMGKVVVLHHSTFFINSLCHCLGSKPYTDTNTAKDSWFMALLTFGEGYHNFHHYFQNDYRNGIMWYHFDPTKWLINIFEKFGMAWDLKVVSSKKILNAKMNMKEIRLARKLSKQDARLEELLELKKKALASLSEWQDFRVLYLNNKAEFTRERLSSLKQKIRESKKVFQTHFHEWNQYLDSVQV
ncbi:hypothetical protein A9Q84_17165 [Halobacteriovorax marinus]|uniref:Fatty acid desaturase domain-containing protein n=1 Tax=Halobacteriovorax marinus TaxID=97084 RepID=A0A1Y5F3K7_9BACT|nr:hypothetical protein A9Q84_17165 [Halobacteriovorax marinus]